MLRARVGCTMQYPQFQHCASEVLNLARKSHACFVQLGLLQSGTEGNCARLQFQAAWRWIRLRGKAYSRDGLAGCVKTFMDPSWCWLQPEAPLMRWQARSGATTGSLRFNSEMLAASAKIK